MDYFKQRRAYRQFKIYEADVSTGQNNLYRELLDYANDEGKLDNEFPVKNSALLSLTGLSESGLKKARNELVQLGLINYTKGRKNSKAPQYKIVNLYQKTKFMVPSWDTRNKNSVPARVDEGSQKGTLVGTQTVAHKELTSTDLDLTGTDKHDDDAGVPNPLELWQDLWGFPNAIAQQDLTDWRKRLGDELVCFAITEAGKYDVKAKGADRYLDRVFDGYTKLKIDTVKKAKQASVDHQERMKAQFSKPKWRQNTPVKKETLPDWAKNEPAESDQVDPAAQADLKKRLAALRSGGGQS